VNKHSSTYRALDLEELFEAIILRLGTPKMLRYKFMGMRWEELIDNAPWI
jgi:hypothetical protein